MDGVSETPIMPEVVPSLPRRLSGQLIEGQNAEMAPVEIHGAVVPEAEEEATPPEVEPVPQPPVASSPVPAQVELRRSNRTRNQPSWMTDYC